MYHPFNDLLADFCCAACWVNRLPSLVCVCCRRFVDLARTPLSQMTQLCRKQLMKCAKSSRCQMMSLSHTCHGTCLAAILSGDSLMARCIGIHFQVLAQLIILTYLFVWSRLLRLPPCAFFEVWLCCNSTMSFLLAFQRHMLPVQPRN